MSENGSKFRWDKAKSRAALLLAQGRLLDEEVAAEVNCSPRQLYRWKNTPVFAARIDHHIKVFDEAAGRRAIARRMARVQALDDRWNRMRSVIEDRSQDPSMLAVPGGPSGLMVREMKSIGGGDTAQVVEEYSVDTGLLRELREHEKQAAQELGQWAEKHEHTGKDGGPLEVLRIGGEASMEDL